MNERMFEGVMTKEGKEALELSGFNQASEEVRSLAMCMGAYLVDHTASHEATNDQGVEAAGLAYRIYKILVNQQKAREKKPRAKRS